MPQGNAPGASKKKKGRAPKHQNTFAFRHNPKSKKTDKILSSPNVGVCRRCHDKIEWRKQYRKYKPRTQPGKCNLCFQKNIMAAYHTICTNCAGSDRAIEAMEQRRSGGSSSSISTAVVQSLPSNGDTKLAENMKEPTILNDHDATPIDPPEPDLAAPFKGCRRRLRVCAMCTSEPALSKYSNGDGEDEDLIEGIHSIEDQIEDGVHDDGRKLTLREIKAMERKIEKMQLEIKERRRQRNSKEDENNGEEGDNDEGSNGEDDNSEKSDGEHNEQDDDDANDPFLLAVGGKDQLLVGEAYQQMLLNREKQT